MGGCATYSRRGLFRLFFQPWSLEGQTKTTDRVLVCVFLRGGADGLNLVVPHGDPVYHEERPSIGLARPDHRGAAEGSQVLDLDGFFGMHPAMAPLERDWKDGRLAFVHAVGSDDTTRSHFEAQDRMERAGAEGSPIGSGWLARHLRSRPGGHPSGLSAVAVDRNAPESLRGAPGAAIVESLEEYRLEAAGDSRFMSALGTLYEKDRQADLARAGRDTLTTIRRLEAIAARDKTAGADYPNHPFGRSLREIARLVRARSGLEVACVDLDGWDTHFFQDNLFSDRVGTLARGLRAFAADLGSEMKRVTVVCMTEFGRRVYENASLGTDHGRGGVMILLGAGVAGGQVVADWPGLDKGNLTGPGDLTVTTDYRDVLSELLKNQFRNPHLDRVFPGHEAKKVGVTG